MGKYGNSRQAHHQRSSIEICIITTSNPPIATLELCHFHYRLRSPLTNRISLVEQFLESPKEIKVERRRKRKMLAAFDKTVAKCPEALQTPQSEAVSALKDGVLVNHFGTVHPGSVTVNLGSSGFMAYTLDKQNPLLPRYYPTSIIHHNNTHISKIDFCILFIVFSLFSSFFFPLR